MANQDHDKHFFNQFSIVMGALLALLAVCIIAAIIVSSGDEVPDEREVALIRERLAPVGTVVTDPAALIKTSAAAVKREPYTADQVLAKACNACHGTGVMGAPKIGDKAAWQARASTAGGVDGLTSSAIKGKNAMPARGGVADLTDDEMHAAVAKMLADSGL